MTPTPSDDGAPYGLLAVAISLGIAFTMIGWAAAQRAAEAQRLATAPDLDARTQMAMARNLGLIALVVLLGYSVIRAWFTDGDGTGRLIHALGIIPPAIMVAVWVHATVRWRSGSNAGDATAIYTVGRLGGLSLAMACLTVALLETAAAVHARRSRATTPDPESHQVSGPGFKSDGATRMMPARLSPMPDMQRERSPDHALYPHPSSFVRPPGTRRERVPARSDEPSPTGVDLSGHLIALASIPQIGPESARRLASCGFRSAADFVGISWRYEYDSYGWHHRQYGLKRPDGEIVEIPGLNRERIQALDRWRQDVLASHVVEGEAGPGGMQSRP